MDSELVACDERADFLAGGGEMGARMRAFDWAATPLGPAKDWPQSLKTAVRIVLTSRFAMWMAWGPELTFFCNDDYLPTTGVKRDWVLGARSDRVWAEIWPDIGPRIDRVLATGEATWDDELLLYLERRGFVEESYHTFSYSPLADDSGAVAGMLCVVAEVTERVIGERQLASLRDLGARLAGAATRAEVTAAFQGCVAADPRDLPFALIYLNAADGAQTGLAAAYGLPCGHPAAPRTIDLADPHAPWPLETAPGHETTEVSGLCERWRDLPDGPWWQKAPERALIVPIRGSEGAAPLGFLIAGLNPHRQLDANYRGFVELLTGQVAAAVARADAFERERARARALAEIDRAKTAFFSNISHEFRTPLTLMMSPLEEALAQDVGGAPAKIRGLVETAHRNSLRLLRLVNALLDFSRVEAGRADAVYEPLDLSAFTADLASNFESVCARAGLSLEVDCAPAPEPACVDRVMWEKIVLNLLSNAFKFTFEGGIKVELGYRDGAARLTVRDTGVGVPAAELPKLFDRFHRVEGQQGRSYEGSGIGLALVQELVRLHGGAISVESEIGRGAAFTVTIPLGFAHLPADRVRQAAAAPGPDASGASGASGARAYVEEALRWIPGDEEAELEEVETAAPADGEERRLRVLLADDNRDMRDYVRRLLSGRYEVEAVADGEAALAAARRLRPDLILTDAMMPRLDGFGLLAAVRADPQLSDVPVVMLSARAGDEAHVEGLEAGADDYLAKPFVARELIARVSANIQLAAARRATAEALAEQARTLQTLNRAASAMTGELDLNRLVQAITDAAVEVTGAQFGAFFYNVLDEEGGSYTLYTLSGAPRSAFEKFPMPRNTAVFGPTFSGEGIVRSDDITLDPRYGHNAPRKGMPEGHLPVRSYLAAPVVSRTGEVLGGLFLGHSTTGVFDARAEELIGALAGQAGVAIDNVRLFEAAQKELGQRRRAEDALHALNAALEQRVVQEVAERARAEAALRQAQKMEAVGQLTGGVAHDFNNLLTVIMGGLDTIRRSQITEEARIRRAADLAMQGAQRAASLTSRLLAFSRRQPLEPKPLDLNLLVRDMTDLLHRTLGEQVELEGVLAPRLWTAEADQNQLEAAILNLAVNARDAMPDGGKLTIETANTTLDESYAATDREVTPGQYVMVSVSDDGWGMSQETLARAFEPFFTTKETGRGTGLGLSMVYGFVKQSGGHVTIYSEQGKGTSVKLYFPRYFGGQAVESDRGPKFIPLASKGEVVLVVEDNEDVRTYSVAILKELGYQVLEAADAEAALAFLQSAAPIDLLFTDVVLPGRSGRVIADAAQTLRPGLKVLFTTGYSRNAIVHQGRLDSGVRLITKPFTFDELAARVRDVLDSVESI